MQFSRLLFLFASTILLATPTSPWPVLPPNIWAKTSKDFIEEPPAVVLLEETRYTEKSVIHFRRTLILNEAGRNFVDVHDLNPDSKEIEGRVIFPNEASLTLRPGIDILRSTQSTHKSHTKKTYRVIFPGVKRHCIVDLRWIEPIEDDWRPIPQYYGFNLNQRLSRNIPTLHHNILFEATAFKYYWSYRFEVDPACKPKTQSTKEGTWFLFENIPSLQPVHFSSTSDLGRPRLFYYCEFDVAQDLRNIYDDISNLNMTYWQIISQIMIWKHFEKEVRLGSEFNKWADAQIKNLPSDPQRRVEELLHRLHESVKPAEELTTQESSILKEAAPKDGPVRIDNLLQAGIADNFSIRVMFYQLLRRANLNPVIIYTVDRDENTFRKTQCNISQFDCILIGIKPTKDQLVAFDPASRWTGGHVLPWYRGSAALIILPGEKQKKWDAELGTVPNPSSNSDWTRSDYQIICQGDIQKIHLKSQASGAPAWLFRRKYAPMDLKNQTQSLQSFLESKSQLTQWNQIGLTGLLNINTEVSWEAEGTKELEMGRSLKIDPFPAFESPVFLPPSWPIERTQPILLPFTNSSEAVCRISVPEGYKVPVPYTYKMENTIGSVEWILEPKTPLEKQVEIFVRMKIITKTSKADSSSYEELKAWTGWIAKALGLVVNFEKVSPEQKHP